MQKKNQGLLPKTLIHLRKKSKLKQKDLAEVMGVSVGMYSKIELGERVVKSDQIPVLAHTLNTDASIIWSLYLADTFYREVNNYPQEFVGKALNILCDKIKRVQ